MYFKNMKTVDTSLSTLRVLLRLSHNEICVELVKYFMITIVRRVSSTKFKMLTGKREHSMNKARPSK
jgi:hypothetical protein